MIWGDDMSEFEGMLFIAIIYILPLLFMSWYLEDKQEKEKETNESVQTPPKKD